MVRMGVVEAYDVLATFASFALDTHQFLGIDVIAVVRGIGARVATTGRASHDTRAVILEASQQNSAALARVRLFAVPANGVVVRLGELNHAGLSVLVG